MNDNIHPDKRAIKAGRSSLGRGWFGFGLCAVSVGMAATWGSSAPRAAGGGTPKEGELPPEACLQYMALWID